MPIGGIRVRQLHIQLITHLPGIMAAELIMLASLGPMMIMVGVMEAMEVDTAVMVGILVHWVAMEHIIHKEQKDALSN